MIYLLHIDTSAANGTVAISADGKLIASRSNSETRNHAGAINNMINDVLADAKCGLTDLCALAVCGGPGSYTGLRIGLATAKGLCYALDKPLLLFNKLTLLAYQNYIAGKSRHSSFLTVLLAREGEYFVCNYDQEFKCVLEPQLLHEEQLKEILTSNRDMLIITNVAENKIISLNINDLAVNHDIEINLLCWAAYAYEQYNCNNTVNLATAEPFYLKQVYTHK